MVKNMYIIVIYALQYIKQAQGFEVKKQGDFLAIHLQRRAILEKTEINFWVVVPKFGTTLVAPFTDSMHLPGCRVSTINDVLSSSKSDCRLSYVSWQNLPEQKACAYNSP